MTRQELGQRGEDQAVAFLEAEGIRVVERNWRCRYGEIDIIAEDPAGDLIFCEVKCRTGLGFGSPLEAITEAKLLRLRRLCGAWLAEHHCDVVGSRRRVRIDAIGIVLRRGFAPRITHVRGIG